MKKSKVKKPMSRKAKEAWIIVACCFAVALIIGSIVGVKMKYPKIKPKDTLKLSSFVSDTSGITLIAHRGLSAVAPENTLPAFEKAGEAKFYGVECDAHITSDGEWVIMHNADTRLMCGKHKKIIKSTSTEIRDLNITNGANIDTYLTVKIPTLTDYLNVCFEYSLVPVIEIKTEKVDYETMKNLYNTVKKTDAGENAVFISFSEEALKQIKIIDSDASCWLLTDALTDAVVDECKQNGFGIDFNANAENLSEEAVKYAVYSGQTVACYTVDKSEVLTKMHTLGVNIFTTDNILPEV